ncbi:hypothetical protein X975_12763, partial [Stegodyphus mimosarum]
ICDSLEFSRVVWHVLRGRWLIKQYEILPSCILVNTFSR